MKTDDLIGLLAADAAPTPILRTGRMVGQTVLAIVAVAGLFLAVAGLRDGLTTALLRPEVMAKTVLPLLLALIALPAVLQSVRPDGVPRGSRLILPGLLAAGLWVWGFGTRPPEGRFADVSGFALTECLVLIVSLSLLPLALLIARMREGATVTPARAGAFAGLAVGGGVAAGYSLFCTQDNPLFYVTWYGVAILCVTALGALAGRRWLSW